MQLTPFQVPAYNAHYEGSYDERSLLWRRLGAADKANNIARLLGDRRPEEVLEVGCGTGAVMAELRRRGIGSRHVGIDLADPAAHMDPVAAELDLRCYDGGTMPFPDNSFDLVYASHVVEHVPEPRGLLDEMSRVARRWIYLEVPCELHVRTTHRELQRSLDIGHINAYTPESFQLLLQSANLTIDRLELFDHSWDVHRFQNSAFKAGIKHVMRRALLAWNPTLASRLFTYHLGVLVTV